MGVLGFGFFNLSVTVCANFSNEEMFGVMLAIELS